MFDSLEASLFLLFISIEFWVLFLVFGSHSFFFEILFFRTESSAKSLSESLEMNGLLFSLLLRIGLNEETEVLSLERGDNDSCDSMSGK